MISQGSDHYATKRTPQGPTDTVCRDFICSSWRLSGSGARRVGVKVTIIQLNHF